MSGLGDIDQMLYFFNAIRDHLTYLKFFDIPYDYLPLTTIHLEGLQELYPFTNHILTDMGEETISTLRNVIHRYFKKYRGKKGCLDMSLNLLLKA
jgi:hypothetical protein